MELSFSASSNQYDCDPATVKLELFDNIALVPNTNDLKRRGKTVHGVKSSSAECNLSVIEKIKSSSVECNPPVIQRVESSSMEHNASVPAKFSIDDDCDDVELRGDTMIRDNEHLFKSVTAISKYVEMFDFGKNYLMVQIQTIENCKIKISIKAIAYAKLAMNFFEDGS